MTRVQGSAATSLPRLKLEELTQKTTKKTDASPDVKATPEKVPTRWPVSAEAQRASRQRSADFENAVRARMQSAAGTSGGLGVARAGLENATADPKATEAPQAPTSTKPTDGTYSKQQLEAMGWLLEGGEVLKGDVGPVQESLRKTADGKTLSKDAIEIPLNLGNSAEMSVIKDPKLGWYKSMVGQPPVKMTPAEVETLKKNLEKQHPEDLQRPEDNNQWYKVAWNGLFPNKQVALEG